MCVIAIKKVGVDLPNDENMRDMWDRNDDGAGFMYAVDNEVIIEKGFMTYRDFSNALAGAEKRLKVRGYDIKDVPVVLHFRITTHGGTNASNTHPFPVSSSQKSLQALDVITDLGMAHNGIIRNTPRSTKISDTMEFILGMVMPMRTLNAKFLNFESTLKLFKDNIDGSRLVFLDKLGKITTVGDWRNGTVEGTEDILYSNLIHEPYVPYNNSHWKDDNYTPREFKTVPVKVKFLTTGQNYAVAKGDDIIGLEMMYPEGEQFNGQPRPLDPEMKIQTIDAQKTFHRFVNKNGSVFYRNNYNQKAKLRVTSSTYWDTLIQLSDDGTEYRIITGKDVVGQYQNASIVEYI